MTSKPRRCVLYARLSVSKEESVSIERQLESCRKYAEGRGWEVIGEFIDDGVSATANRPEDRRGWNALLDTQGFDAVVIWKVDRLARRVLDFLNVDQILQNRGAGLVAVEDPIDMTTPMGRAFATILAVFGEMEAAAIASRVKAARAFIIKEGRWPGGGVPYGYASAPNPSPDAHGHVLCLDPERFPWLAEIVERGRRGEGPNAIARWLDRHGAPLPRKSRPGGTWNRQTVIGILRNPILAGMTPYNPGRGKSGGAKIDPFSVLRDADGSPVINRALAVISVEEFAELQNTLAARSTPQARPFAERARTSPFLARVARCDQCGVYMCRGTNQKRPVIYCPKCRQTIGRTHLDSYLIERLLAERGAERLRGFTVAEQWRAALTEETRRSILLSQLGSLRIQRGLVGRNIDLERIILEWKQPATAEEEAA